MPKKFYTIRDWSGGMNNRKDPRDLRENEYSLIQDMSVDSLGKIKTAGGLYDHKEGADGSTDLSQYIVERTGNLTGAGGYGLHYFESDQGRDVNYEITDAKHPGTSNPLVLSGSNFSLAMELTSGDATVGVTGSGVGDNLIFDNSALFIEGTGVPEGAFVDTVTDTGSDGDVDSLEMSANATAGDGSSAQRLDFTMFGSISFVAAQSGAEDVPTTPETNPN